MMGAPHRLGQRWVRIVPHVVDTVLLVSAIGLAVMIGNYPGTHGWLTAKVVGLIGYIVLGSIALKRGRTQRVRVAAFAAALAMFAYIVSVAITKSLAGATVMLAFGLGTLPNLAATGLLIGRAQPMFDRTRLRFAAAALLVTFAAVGIYRVLYVPHALATGPFCLVPW